MFITHIWPEQGRIQVSESVLSVKGKEISGGSKGMVKVRLTMMVAAAILLGGSLVSWSEAANTPGQGEAIVTVIPKKGHERVTDITLQDLQLKINGKETKVASWVPMRGANDDMEMVLLIDTSARNSLGQQLNDIEHFIKSVPANAKFALGYMDNGQAMLTGPLSADHTLALSKLHLPGGLPGSSGGPYFALSDLAHRWPSNDPRARRIVVMITDGVDIYNPRFDPEDPYIQAAIQDSIRARLVVFSIYWHDMGRFDNTQYFQDSGQSLLAELTQATGGDSFWMGTGEPVSFQPFFEDLSWRLENQYRLNFYSELKEKPEIRTMNVKVGGAAIKVYAPQQVYVTPALAQ